MIQISFPSVFRALIETSFELTSWASSYRENVNPLANLPCKSLLALNTYLPFAHSYDPAVSEQKTFRSLTRELCSLDGIPSSSSIHTLGGGDGGGGLYSNCALKNECSAQTQNIAARSKLRARYLSAIIVWYHESAANCPAAAGKQLVLQLIPFPFSPH